MFQTCGISTAQKCSQTYFGIYTAIDLFSLYVLFSHFKPRDGTPMSFYAQASTCKCMHNQIKWQKANSLENDVMWSELEKNEQAS